MSNQFQLVSSQFFNSDVFSSEVLIKIARNKLKTRNEIKVRLAILTVASHKSENASSTVFRGKLKVEILKADEACMENIDFIMKVSFLTAPELKSLSVYTQEKRMYDDVIKNLEEIWREKKNEIVEFSPKCYEILSNPYDVIILQDLHACGYSTVDPIIGLNLNQSKFVLSKLVKFHAASAVCYQEVIIKKLIMIRKK